MSNRKSSAIEEIRALAEEDLVTFAQLVNPTYLYGDIHKEVYKWLSSEDAKPNQLLLMPRAHMKSHQIAVWCAWWITKHPETTILYVSATATLAEAQLLAIKNILDSSVYRRYWPEMTNVDEGKRARWTTSEIIVDHPKRKEERIRDATVKAVGITSTTTGLHADVIIYDDVVVPENAYTEDGRTKVAAALSQMASIKNAGGITKCVGTRYHPKDQYDLFKNQQKKVFDDEGNIVGTEAIWDVKEHVVEVDGKFLWPKAYRADGKAFGFDWPTLASIEAEYEDRTQFYAQYYNNPNDPESQRISRDKFQYYDVKFLKNEGGQWYFKNNPLNVYAAIDFAFSMAKKADFTAIVVIGVDPDNHVYVLDIDRFKADKVIEYFNKVAALHTKWGFRKLRAEVTVAQTVIVRELKDYLIRDGLRLSIDEHRPNRHQGAKEERIAAALEHRYDNQSVWHFKGGYISMLEEELVLARPPHDDIKDALASAVEIAIPPANARKRNTNNNVIQFHGRFGGTY